ncbi:unnamed protein product [Coffea canephora]|uniref:DH200=94 genomic scaffold, scaffold_6776 n=1 Tax=Coffea canephora TaxID=49390 RepID=A0A068VMI5_COFCA|nr:unnamed protein product [Coffea canephora]
MTSLISLPFTLSINLIQGGIVLQILACALYNNWWPMLTGSTYALNFFGWLGYFISLLRISKWLGRRDQILNWGFSCW